MDAFDVSNSGLQRLASGHEAQSSTLSRSTNASMPSSGEEDLSSEDDYDRGSKSFVARQLDASTPLPPVTWSNLSERIIWFNLITVILTPLLSLYGILTTRVTSQTLIFSIVYYVWNMLGITAG
ncbi:hypothetical protein QCA50_001230 [Cerrena zonata]|uniref:Uncharacterized protein n=1 Tax=Cerrena zonata TaxID=2478898 RepID=A0AAW0GWA0_9APHY